jgi:uncharacterized protein YxjI
MKTYLIHQKIRPLVNQYNIYEHDDASGSDNLIAFTQQKRFAFKEKFTAYTDESKQNVSFTIQSRQVLDFGARYDVTDASGTSLGVIGKDFKSSLLRSTWHIFLPGHEDTPALIVQERNKNIALIRRAWEFLPGVSELPFFFRYHFDFVNPLSNQVNATYNKTTYLVDHYQLTVNGGVAETMDPRVLISLGIMMDALQGR